MYLLKFLVTTLLALKSKHTFPESSNYCDCKQYYDNPRKQSPKRASLPMTAKISCQRELCHGCKVLCKFIIDLYEVREWGWCMLCISHYLRLRFTQKIQFIRGSDCSRV